ncbi:fructokinase-1-like [Andrographis paniculata]|uniref:fructokinase-1-like n=1 Tax=Andrographis paniculata TaxID=175694 RepID=UPI0021E98FAB|nr:fructokinase-1-like [Andrographis paniculata]
MHNHVSLSLQSNRALFSPYLDALQNPRFSPKTRFQTRPVFKCCGIQTHVPPQLCRNSINYANGSLEGDRGIISVGVKDFDVATLGNLCVDIVLNVPKLPPKRFDERRAYLEELAKSPPDKNNWEAGGNCNMAIAAARLGLRVASIGHVGDEVYGRFLLDVLHGEGISMVEMNEQNYAIDASSTTPETLLCWVLVDPWHRHDFCSPVDFHQEPAFGWIQILPTKTKMAIRRSKIMFCNGYGFDELSPQLLVSALEYAVEVGTSIFFDPGPRGKSLIAGAPEEQMALDKYLRMSDVLLLTSDEAESLTGRTDPILAGQELLRNGVRTKWVIIKMGPRGSILITPSSISCAPAFKVNVIDTVGCGDSFVAPIAFGYIHDMSLVQTLTVANAVGAATATGCGAGRNVAALNKVLELVTGSDLYEDDKFWVDLLKEHSETDEITILTKNPPGIGNKNNTWLQHTPLKEVVSELLPKLGCQQALQIGAS